MSLVTALEPAKWINAAAALTRDVVPTNPNAVPPRAAPVTGHPDVARVVAPVFWAAGVIRPVSDLNVDALRTGSADGDDGARCEQGADQELSISGHTPVIRCSAA